MRYRPALLSFFLHLCLLVLAAWLIRGARPGGLGGEPLRRTAIVLATAPADQPSDYLDEHDVEETAADPPAAASPESPPELPPEAFESPSGAPDSAPPVDLSSLDAGAMARAGTGSSSNLEAAFSQSDLAAIAREQRELAGRRPAAAAATTSVFGSGPLTGTRFVFVLDRSASMGAGGLGVLGRAREEIDRALASLTDEHYFQVVAYHQSTVMVDRRDMLPVTRENRRIAGEFLDHLAAFGPTIHEGALYSALALMPDVVVLLSDGGSPQLHDGQIAALLKANRSRATFHCVEFGVSDLTPTGSFMERLALASGGTYRYVDVKKWRR